MKWYYFDWISFTILYLNLTFCYRAFTFSPLFSPHFFLRCFISFFFLSFDYFLDELYRLYPHEFQNAQLMAKEDVDMHKWTDSRRWNRRSPLCQFWYHAHTIIFFSKVVQISSVYVLVASHHLWFQSQERAGKEKKLYFLG